VVHAIQSDDITVLTHIGGWQLYGTSAAVALREMFPYLLEKREQAVLGLDFQENVDKWRTRFRPAKGRPMPEWVFQYRAEVAEQLSALKRTT